MRGSLKIIGLCLALLFVCGLEEQTGFSQPSQKPDKDPLVEVGRIDFRLKEVQATPSPIRMLEIQIEIINPSPKETVPPNSIKVIAIPKEIRFSSESAASPFYSSSGRSSLKQSPPSQGCPDRDHGFLSAS